MLNLSKKIFESNYYKIYHIMFVLELNQVIISLWMWFKFSDYLEFSFIFIFYNFFVFYLILIYKQVLTNFFEFLTQFLYLISQIFLYITHIIILNSNFKREFKFFFTTMSFWKLIQLTSDYIQIIINLHIKRNDLDFDFNKNRLNLNKNSFNNDEDLNLLI